MLPPTVMTPTSRCEDGSEQNEIAVRVTIIGLEQCEGSLVPWPSWKFCMPPDGL